MEMQNAVLRFHINEKEGVAASPSCVLIGPCLFVRSLFEGLNLLVSSGTVCAIAADRLALIKRRTRRDNDIKVPESKLFHANMIFLMESLYFVY